MAKTMPLAGAVQVTMPGFPDSEDDATSSGSVRPASTRPPIQSARGRHRFKARRRSRHLVMWEQEQASAERQAHANSLRGGICLLRPLLDQTQSPAREVLAMAFHQLCTRLHHQFPNLAALHAVPRSLEMWERVNAAAIAPREFALERRILVKTWIIHEGEIAKILIPLDRSRGKRSIGQPSILRHRDYLGPGGHRRQAR